MNISEKINDFKKNVLGMGLFTKEDEKKMYERKGASFADALPYEAYDNYTETWILEDGFSRAAAFTLQPIPTAGVSSNQLVSAREYLRTVYEVFERLSPEDGQWVMQEFYYNDNRVSNIMKTMRDYVDDHAKGTEFTEEYLRITEHHLNGMNKEEGIYFDEKVTMEQWGLRIPRVKIIVYRRMTKDDLSKQANGSFDAAQELNEKVEELRHKFEGSGIKFKRDAKEDVLYWLFDMFNGFEGYEGSTREEYIKRMIDIDDDDDELGVDVSEALLVDRPISNTEDNTWTFGNKKSRFLRFSGLRKKPRIGQLVGEVKSGEGKSKTTKCTADSLPKNSIITRTLVFTHRSDVESTLSKLERRSRGVSTEAAKSRRIYEEAHDSLIDSDESLRCSMGVYFFGENTDEMNKQQRKIISRFSDNNIVLMKDTEDSLCLDAYLLHLPMNFKPKLDPKFRYLRPIRMDHTCNLSLLFGRSEGSGNPALMFFNRGGTPVFHDPLNGKERAMNGFTFVVGPPGSGKSVTLSQMAIMNMAIHRPRLFIVEYGNSFGLVSEFFEKFGLSVNRLKLDMVNAPSLAPFNDIDKVLEGESLDDFDEWDLDSISSNDLESDLKNQNFTSESEKDESNDEERDVLGELELICFLMITGGEKREFERYSRADRQLIRDTLIKTASRMREIGKDKNLKGPKPCITQDVIDTMNMISIGKYDTKDRAYTDDQKSIIKIMLTTLEMFTSGFNHRLFNRPGEAWPDADVTLIDLAELSKNANEDKLAVAYTSLMQHVNNLAEKHQNSARQILMYTDECHLVCSNPLLGPFLVKMVKTFRKLQTWPLFATQNVSDMAGGSAKLLSMIEWYIALNTEPEEAELIQKIKGLSNDTTKLLSSTSKQARAYTEGVILSKNYETQFRSSPASLFLTLAMTEGHEKNERRKIREEKTCSELEAAYYMAKEIDKARGFKNELSF